MTENWYAKLQQAADELRIIDKEIQVLQMDLRTYDYCRNIGNDVCANHFDDILAAHVRTLTRLESITPPTANNSSSHRPRVWI
ncbi:MAG: hypothetical protein FWG40_06780 [Peptococcaceae bacterium]|nr:hypothetical protein [Peptococcaceae bacterium]